MPRSRALSHHARELLAKLLAAADRWSYGYELSSLTGIKSGTLYPLLIRLEAQGFLEAEWLPPMVSGRPPRHAYRLTAAGRRLARGEGEAAAPALAARARLDGLAS
ncbi:MAG: PadR family transcriptional regulator [Allosphingosinicella sp.]